MKKLMTYALIAAAMAPAAVFAEGTEVSGFITATQTTIIGYVGLLVAAIVAVMSAGLTLRALPFIYRRVCSFFGVAK